MNPVICPLVQGIGIAALADVYQVFGEFPVLFKIWARKAEEGRPADWETYESPFIACLESARIRLKEGSYLRLSLMGGHGPFRGLDAPRVRQVQTSPRN